MKCREWICLTSAGAFIRNSNLSKAGCCRFRRSTRSTTNRAAIRTANRWCSCMAAPAPAATASAGGSSIRGSIASCCSTSAVAAVRRRTPNCAKTPRGTWSRTSSACASICASNVGRCSAVRGAPRWRWPTPKRIPSVSRNWCCAASSCCGIRSWPGSTRKAATCCIRTRGRNISPRFRKPNTTT